MECTIVSSLWHKSALIWKNEVAFLPASYHTAYTSICLERLKEPDRKFSTPNWQSVTPTRAP